MENIELLKQLEELHKISGCLEVNREGREEMLALVSGYSNDFIDSLTSIPGFDQQKPEGLAINDCAQPLGDLLKLYHSQVAMNGINGASGTHLGYIPGGGLFTSALADYLAAITNPHTGVYYASPGAVTIENEVVEWLKRVFNFPSSSVGNLTSGGSISMLIAFTAARDNHGIKGDKITRSVVYISEQVHHSVHKALRIIGLEDIIIRYVDLDSGHRIKTEALKSAVAEDVANGFNPFMVVGTAGTTDTGAVDPLDDIADVAQLHGMWYHVDAAYGGFFIMTSKKHLFKGLERADSLVVDPHKGLSIPFGLGGVLVKNKEAVLHSNHYVANYMQDAVMDELVQSPSNVSPELTRHFRALRLWLPLQLHGIEPFVASLEEKLLLIKYFRNELVRMGFEVAPEPDLSVSYFRYPFNIDADAKNHQLMDAIHADGDVFLSSSIIDGRYVIRIALLSFRTKKDTVDRALAMIERCLKRIES